MKYMKELRQKIGITQAELAERVGIGMNTIARYERGEMAPSIQIAHAIAQALHVTEAELLNGPEETKIRIELIFDKMNEEEIINMTGNKNVFSLFLSPDGVTGIRGAARFTSIEDIKKFIADAEAQLIEAFKWQQERGAITATA